MSIELLKCLRCGYEWYPRTPEPPKYCANKKCRSPYWNKPKVKQSGPQRKADKLYELRSTSEEKPLGRMTPEEIISSDNEEHLSLAEAEKENEIRRN